LAVLTAAISRMRLNKYFTDAAHIGNICPMNTNQHYTIGLIGGTGGMGSLFQRVFSELGHTVLVASRRTALSIEDCAAASDIVIITVPIKNTLDIIERVGPHVRPDAVLMDFTSLKKREVNAMCAATQAEVIGCHPVFGPHLASLESQVIVLTPGRGDVWLPRIAALLEDTGAHVEITSADRHDELMAIVQGLIHFTSITFVTTMRRLGTNPRDVAKFSSPVYRMRSDFAERILNQDPELYADIAIANPKVADVLRTYLETSQELFGMIEQKNRDGFIRIFSEASDYLGEEKKDAESRTDRIIEFASSLQGKHCR
jgi:prephenate dehydrogenase